MCRRDAPPPIHPAGFSTVTEPSCGGLRSVNRSVQAGPVRINGESSMPTSRSISRRRFLAATASATALTTVGGVARPFLSYAADRPVISHGLQSGDVSIDSGVVWARADRPSRLTFRNLDQRQLPHPPPRRQPGRPAGERFRREGAAGWIAGGSGDLLPHHSGWPLGADDEGRADGRTFSHRTAPADRRSISFVWSGDTAGQGWRIDESRGGMRIYETMRSCGRIFSCTLATRSTPMAPLRPRRS